MANNFQLERSFAQIGDIQKSWAWTLEIPNFNTVAGTVSEEDLKLRARSISIPSRGVSTIISNYFGMEQVFTGKPNFTHTINVLCEEFDDQKVIIGFHKWQNLIFDISTGVSQVSKKRAYTLTVYIQQYDSAGTPTPLRIQLNNAFVQEVSEVTLDYNQSDSVKYSITLGFDTWELVKTII